MHCLGNLQRTLNIYSFELEVSFPSLTIMKQKEIIYGENFVFYLKIVRLFFYLHFVTIELWRRTN